MSDTVTEIDTLANVISAGAILLEVIKKVKTYYEKKRVKQAFWNLVGKYADKYEESYGNLIRVLGKMFGYAVFLSTNEYEKELKELTKEFNEYLEVMINSLHKIIESIAIHKDTLKTVLSKEDWLIIDHISSTYTNGKVNWEKLMDPGFVNLLLGENYSPVISRDMNENFIILSNEINKILEKHGLEVFTKIGGEFHDYVLKHINMLCILTKILECIIDTSNTET